MKFDHARAVFAVTLAGMLSAGGVPAKAAPETLQSMLAAQIRAQGFVCEKPLSARKDRRLSRPDRGSWVLRCSNATFRVSRVPDLAATVEPLP